MAWLATFSANDVGLAAGGSVPGVRHRGTAFRVHSDTALPCMVQSGVRMEGGGQESRVKESPAC